MQSCIFHMLRKSFEKLKVDAKSSDKKDNILELRVHSYYFLAPTA